MSLSQSFQRIVSGFQRFRSKYTPTRRLLVILLLCGILGMVMYSTSFAFLKAHQAKQAELAVRTQLEAAKKIQSELKQKEDWLKSPEGILAESHRGGLAKPDEEVIHSASGQPATEKSPTYQKVNSADSWLGGILLSALLLCVVVLLSTAGLLLYRWRALKKRRPVGVLTPRSELRRRRGRDPLPDTKILTDAAKDS